MMVARRKGGGGPGLREIPSALYCFFSVHVSPALTAGRLGVVFIGAGCVSSRRTMDRGEAGGHDMMGSSLFRV